MTELDQILGQMIRDYRIKGNFTQADLAKKLGYGSTQFVSLFERGLSKIPLNVLGQLIILLNIPEKRVVKMLLDRYKKEVRNLIEAGKTRARK